MATEPVVHVIDDDEAARQSLEFLLDCAGLKVKAYESAVEFLKAVPTMEHGCIVTDVRMPEMSGVELIGRLKALGVHSVFHYVPLHSSPAGRRFARAAGGMANTEALSDRLLRLPLWIGLDASVIERIAETVERL